MSLKEYMDDKPHAVLFVAIDLRREIGAGSFMVCLATALPAL
jgi:hypothetical protein